MKQLFWKDKTGRGFSNTLTPEDILGLENEEDWNGYYSTNGLRNVNSETGGRIG
ncbi:MAG: hypothetical protein U5K71_03545 [Gracilimonas sp.]|nr:hypothetical protein [Gracilimonas sp.]